MVLLVPQPSGVFSESGWEPHRAEIVSEKALCCSWWPGVTSDTQSQFFSSFPLPAPPHLHPQFCTVGLS